MSGTRERLIGLDFGGTAVKAGAVTPEGEVLEERTVPIAAENATATDVLDRTAEAARALGAKGRAGAVGIGCAGLLDRERGVLVSSPNLAWLDGTCLTGELAARLDLDPARVILENDANVAALGEQWLGAARGESDVFVVTLGTGIGGALILGGRLFAGPGGAAGEIGHVVVEPEGIRCGCGSRGCLETLASATAARRRALERALPANEPGSLERLCAAARIAEGAERRLLFEIGRDLGHGLSYVVGIVDIGCFVFAGGFAAALDLLETGIRTGLSERTFGEREVRLLSAELGGSAGWIGAARLVRDATR